jgi:hypothetical protein
MQWAECFVPSSQSIWHLLQQPAAFVQVGNELQHVAALDIITMDESASTDSQVKWAHTPQTVRSARKQ